MRHENEPPVRIDRHSPVPIHWQIYEGLRLAITQGSFGPGERMTSTRRLADVLSVSRNTVALAYELLAQEGFLEARRGSGFVVMAVSPSDAGRPFPARGIAAAESRRRAIVAATRSLVLEAGIPRLTMLEISRRAALPPSVIYSSFESVDAIVSTIARESFALLRDFMAAAPRSADRVTDLAAVGERYVQFAHEHADVFQLLFQRLAPSAGASWSWLEAPGSPYAYICGLVREGRDAPADDAEIDAICYFVWAVAHGLANLRTSFLRHWGGSSLDRDRAVLRRAANAALHT